MVDATDTILATLGVLLVLTALERLANQAPSDWRRNLQAWVINLCVGLLAIRVLPSWTGGSLLNLAQWPFWIGAALYVLISDFLEFAYHIAQHRVPWLWNMHALHHSDPDMSAQTTDRHFWGDHVIKGLTIWPLCALITGPSAGLIVVHQLLSFYNYLIHARLRIDFGRWSWLLNCPAYHRQHHSRLIDHHNTNFAALFPIWDVVLGTYRRPTGWPPSGLDGRAPQSIRDLLFWPWSKTVPQASTKVQS